MSEQDTSATEYERSDVSVVADGGSDPPTVAVSDTFDDATTRDRVWSAAVRLLARRHPLGFQLFQVREEAALDESKDRTIRRTLNAMEELDWLQRDDGEKYWHPGERVTEVVEADVPDRDPLEKIDERIEHLRDHVEFNPEIQPALQEQIAEFEMIRDRITGDAPSEKINGDESDE